MYLTPEQLDKLEGFEYHPGRKSYDTVRTTKGTHKRRYDELVLRWKPKTVTRTWLWGLFTTTSETPGVRETVRFERDWEVKEDGIVWLPPPFGKQILNQLQDWINRNHRNMPDPEVQAFLDNLPDDK